MVDVLANEFGPYIPLYTDLESCKLQVSVELEKLRDNQFFEAIEP